MLPKEEKIVVHDPYKAVAIPEPSPAKFAVVELRNKQLKVVEDDEVVLEYLDLPVGTVFEIKPVLLIGTPDYTSVGRPVVESARVLAVVEQHTLAEKLIVFKKRRRKGYQKSQGHRQRLTTLRILKVEHLPAQKTVDNYSPLINI